MPPGAHGDHRECVTILPSRQARPCSTPDRLRNPHATDGALPCGVIAPILSDNVLVGCGDRIGGVIDFYFAGVDSLLFRRRRHRQRLSYLRSRMGASTPQLLRAYARRPTTPSGRSHWNRRLWPAMLRSARAAFLACPARQIHHLPAMARWCWSNHRRISRAITQAASGATYRR